MAEDPRDDEGFTRALGPRLHDLAWAEELEQPWADPLPEVRRRVASGSDEAPRPIVTDDGFDERWRQRRRSRRIRTALSVAAGVVVLGGLGTYVAVTGLGQATSDSASGGFSRADSADGGAAAAPEAAGACTAVPSATATGTTLRTTVTSPRRTIQPTATSTASVSLAPTDTAPTTLEATAYVRRGAAVVGRTLPVALTATAPGEYGTFDVPMIGCDGAGLSPGDYTVVVVVRYVAADGGPVVLVSTGRPVTVT